MKMLPAECQPRAMAIGVNTTSAATTDADFILAPQAALKASSDHDKVLLVFDDVLLHKFKEKHIYELANQPFAPINIVNEIMEHTGCFTNGRTVTSIVVMDTETNQLQFQKDEDALLVHLESIADSVVEFSDDQHKRRLGNKLPVLPTKPGQKLPN